MLKAFQRRTQLAQILSLLGRRAGLRHSVNLGRLHISGLHMWRRLGFRSGRIGLHLFNKLKAVHRPFAQRLISSEFNLPFKSRPRRPVVLCRFHANTLAHP